MKLTYLSCEAPMAGSASHTHIHEIIKGFEKRGWDVKLYVPSYAHKDQKPNLFHRLIECIRIQLRLCIEWRRGSVIYVRAHYLAFPTSVMAKIFNIPIFHEINGPFEDVFVTHPQLNKFKSILIPMQKFQFKTASGLVAVTEDLRRWVSAQSRNDNSILISNAANTDIFYSNVPAASGSPRQYVIFFGSLAKWHGIDMMLNAVNHPSWPQDVSLLILGDGGGRDQIEAAAKVNINIVYKGAVPYQELPSYIGSAIAGLVTITNPQNRSDTGLNPLKLFETLACSIPVIVTNFRGQADLVRENNCGIIIEPDDAHALAKAVSYLASNPEIARDMGTRGHDIIHAKHSWDQKAGETEDFILRTIAKK